MSVVEVGGRKYDRIPIRTHVIKSGEDIAEVVDSYTRHVRQPRDIIVVSEKATAASQGRAVPIAEIHPGLLARFLVRFVTKSRHGIGLGMAETLEMAIRECGAPRILLAALIAGASRTILGRRGDFYRIAGDKARAIDGPCGFVIPPYNRCVVLGPRDPDAVAKSIKLRTSLEAAIVDINDLGQDIMGVSSGLVRRLPLKAILRDNPLGQSREQTPIGLIRELP